MSTAVITTLSLIIAALLVIYILNLIVDARLKNRLSEIENPSSVGWLKAGVFVSAGLMMRGITEASLTTSQVLQKSNPESPFVEQYAYFSIFLGISLVSFLLILMLSTLLFTAMNRGLGILEETANGNVRAVVIFIGIILASSLAVNEGLPAIYDLFIPYPTLPQFY